MKNLLDRLNHRLQDLIRSIGALAQAKGMRSYIVGGPVRDLVLDLRAKVPMRGRRQSPAIIDLDITVEGQGIRLAEAFAASHRGAKVVRYLAFGTASVHLPDGTLIDFATARKETYARGGAFPHVKPSGIKDDLLRRDFTINAMAVAINPSAWGKLIDPFGGMEDLKGKRIRVLHDKSFLDDPTRILRAARFKARLGLRMEAHTLKILKSAVKIKVLDSIKPQRYLKDFKKILQEPKSLEAIECLKAWKAYR